MTSAETARKVVQENLKSMQSKDSARMSSDVCARFIRKFSAHTKNRPKMVGLYRAQARELDLSAIEEFLHREKVSLCYPRMLNATSSLEMVEVPDPRTPEHWISGPYEISEPHVDLPVVAPSKIDWIFVPGVAFGMNGERIGRGKGYYDRLLAGLPQALRIALGFGFQLFSELEQKAWDQPVHWIMTEQREIRLPAAQRWLERLSHE